MNYLQKKFDWNRDDLVCQYDELPLWSSPFGWLLLNNIPLGNYSYYLDIAFGTGFPLIDISQRLGSRCKSYGIDPWKKAVDRTSFKIATLGLSKVEVIEGCASKMPFPDNHFDLITSNLGINNFSTPAADLSECYRVIKPGASFCLTTNLIGHFQEFYSIYSQTLQELELYDKYKLHLEQHINHRGSTDSHSSLLKESGFTIKKIIESQFHLRFLDGTAFLNHTFVIGGFLDPWRSMFEECEQKAFFEKLESNLNKLSQLHGELKMTVPMVYIECFKE